VPIDPVSEYRDALHVKRVHRLHGLHGCEADASAALRAATRTTAESRTRDRSGRSRIKPGLSSAIPLSFCPADGGTASADVSRKRIAFIRVVREIRGGSHHA
jgi:hypothetical protein